MSFYHVYSCLVSQMQMLLKTFLCRRDDIFGRYFGMILLYFGTNKTENEFQSMTASQGNQSFNF